MTGAVEPSPAPRCRNCEAELDACEACGSQTCAACTALPRPRNPACGLCAQPVPSARRQAVRFWESKRLAFSALIAVLYIVVQYVIPYPCPVVFPDGLLAGAIVLVGANLVYTLGLGIDWLGAALFGKRSRLLASILLGAGILTSGVSAFGLVGLSHFWDGDGICATDSSAAR